VVSNEIVLDLRFQQQKNLRSNMWHLIEDFFEQSLVMKAFIGLGWLSIIIMVTSMFLV
jgi:hypothetical protein